jgi:hypothetical protein
MAGPSSTPRPGRLQRIRAAFAPPAGGGPVLPGTDRWASGDMAECIHGGPWVSRDGFVRPDPCEGHVAIVRSVHLCQDKTGALAEYLLFARWPGEVFAASAFRKLTPRADAATPASATFLRGLKHGRLAAPSLIDRLAARLERILS